jgi:hypothetical protein
MSGGSDFMAFSSRNPDVIIMLATLGVMGRVRRA